MWKAVWAPEGAFMDTSSGPNTKSVWGKDSAPSSVASQVTYFRQQPFRQRLDSSCLCKNDCARPVWGCSWRLVLAEGAAAVETHLKILPIAPPMRSQVSKLPKQIPIRTNALHDLPLGVFFEMLPKRSAGVATESKTSPGDFHMERLQLFGSRHPSCRSDVVSVVLLCRTQVI